MYLALYIFTIWRTPIFGTHREDFVLWIVGGGTGKVAQGQSPHFLFVQFLETDETLSTQLDFTEIFNLLRIFIQSLGPDVRH